MPYIIATEGFQVDQDLRDRAQLLSEKFHERVANEDKIRFKLARTDKRHVEATAHVHAFHHEFIGHGRGESAITALNAAMETLTRQALEHHKKMVDRQHHAPSVAEFVRS